MNFLDPLKTKEGLPYGPERFRKIVQERYLISKHTNTSYLDTGKITPTEKDIILDLIADDLKKSKEAVEAAKSNKIK